MKDYQNKKFKGFKLKIYKGVEDGNFLEKCCLYDTEKPSDFQTVTSSLYSRVFKFNHKGKDYYYKIFLDRNILEPWKDFFRGTRAERSLKGDLLLLKNGFNVPRCIMVGKKGNFNFSVTEAAPNALNMLHLENKELYPGLNREQVLLKKNLFKNLGRVIGKMHARRIIHGDLRWGNILIQNYSSSPRVWFLDNERTTYYGRNLPDRKRLKNLVQINMTLNPGITNGDRMTFFKAYLIENPELVGRRHELASKVQDKTAARLTKYRK